MTSLENRILQLERARGNADLNAMTDAQLSAYIRTLENGAPRWWNAVLASVMRHPSALPIVVNDPDHAGGRAQEAARAG